MECKSLFSRENKEKNIHLLSAEVTNSVVSIKQVFTIKWMITIAINWNLKELHMRKCASSSQQKPRTFTVSMQSDWGPHSPLKDLLDTVQYITV